MSDDSGRPTIEADFRRDLIQHCRDELKSNGFKFKDEQDPNREHLVLMQFFNAEHRLIPQMPRRLLQAPSFLCPPLLQPGLFAFFGKVRRGDDLMPHASRNVMRADRGDQMLNDWGIHHFHLGLRRSRKDPRFVNGTAEVLFAVVTKDAVHCIAVMPHEDADGLPNFAEQKLLETVHGNWPELLARANMNMTGVPMTKATLAVLRDKHCNTVTSMSDGTTYASVSGGTNSAGTSVKAVYKADRSLFLAREAQRILEESIDSVCNEAIERGVQLPSRLRFSLASRDGWVCALEPKVRLLVRLFQLDKWA